MIKKHFKPILLGLFILALCSLLLLDSQRNRFGNQADDTGLKAANAGGDPVLGKFEWTWYDLKFHMIDRFHLRGRTHAKGVLVAKIDDDSLQKFGRWPWSRGVYSDILYYLNELGAEVVAFDAVFSEPEFKGKYLTKYMSMKADGFEQSIQEKYKLQNSDVDDLSKSISEIGTLVFGSAVRHLPKTVLGYIWESREACNLYDPTDPKAMKGETGQPLDPDEAGDKGLLHVKRLTDDISALSNQGISVEGFPPLEGKGETSALNGFCPTVSRGSISHNAKYQGVFSAMADSDGIFRRIPMVVGLVSSFLNAIPKDDREFLPPEWFQRATFFPSLALEAVTAFWDERDPQTGEVKHTAHPRVELARTANGREIIRAILIDRPGKPPVRIDTLPDGMVPINFYGSQETRDAPIGEFSLGQINRDLNDPDFRARYGLDIDKPLRNQIVIIGPTALGVSDLRPNPVQGDAAGVYLHATMIGRILEAANEPAAKYSVHFASLGLNLAILWTLGLLLIVWLVYVRSLAGVGGTIALVVIFLAVDFWAFTQKALAFDAMTITLGLTNVFIGIFVWKYLTEERDRAFVKGAFEKYVSPDLVGQILQDPKKLNLGGQKKELTVMFSDIRGFTTISEKMGAAELAKFLNEYLSPMTDVIQANKGTIDKYMGDAIMAIFGAPIEYPEHAPKAVDAALEMMGKLTSLYVDWEARQLPKIEIGIGINTGDMSVGNMGSSRIFSYTVMGDSVNLGSRLEGINKEYGTNIIISEYTRSKLGPEYVCRELDRVKVKGKKLPVTIFEVMGKGEWPERRATGKRFEEGLALYYAQKFTEARAVFETQAASDKTSAIYVQRCELWLEEAPEAGWDGSWTMKTK